MEAVVWHSESRSNPFVRTSVLAGVCQRVIGLVQGLWLLLDHPYWTPPPQTPLGYHAVADMETLWL